MNVAPCQLSRVQHKHRQGAPYLSLKMEKRVQNIVQKRGKCAVNLTALPTLMTMRTHECLSTIQACQLRNRQGAVRCRL